MNYILMPSLEQITLAKIATILWNQDDIRDLMAKFDFPLFGMERQAKWQEIENEVIQNVAKLLQPKPLKEKILGFIKPIGDQILRWLEYHDNNCYIKIDLPDKLSWTPQGTVDKKKTAEVLVKDENLDITKRYKLACIYCLENDIPALWNKIPESCRSIFYSEEDPIEVNQRALIVLWTYDIKGQLARLNNMVEKRWRQNCTPYQYAFEYAAVGGNKAAAEHFLQKLTSQEREHSLVRSTEYVANKRHITDSNKADFAKEHYADVLCFLLSQMDEEQQIEVFKSYPYEVLNCFLDWPWQSFFINMSKHMWSFLSEKDYDKLLIKIVTKVMDGYKDYNYHRLFRMFWQQSPTIYKRYVINKCASGLLLLKLLMIEGEDIIRLILKDATVKEKKKLIFYNRGQNICEDLIYSGKWGFLKFFVQECISSKHDIFKFKEKFKERISWCCSRESSTIKSDWDIFFDILDDIIQENDKQTEIEGEDSSPVKKLRIIEHEKVLNSIKK